MLLINSCAWPIEGAGISEPFSHCLLILLVKLCEGGVIFHGTVNTVGTHMPYDGSGFAEFPSVSEGRHHDASGIKVSAAKPPSLVEYW